MPPIVITYKALKVVFENLGSVTIYYIKVESGGYKAVVITSQNNLQCDVIIPEDIEDFNVNILPSASEVDNLDDAFGLVPLNLTPPPPK